jgi:hypothetical protein
MMNIIDALSYVKNMFMEQHECALCSHDFDGNTIGHPNICYNLQCINCNKLMHINCYENTKEHDQKYSLCPFCKKVGCISTHHTIF